MQIRRLVPWAMAAGRAALGPLVVVGERCGWSGVALASMVVAALVSDIFDGVLARRWHCDTAGVRLFDSLADTVFYACAALAIWMGMPAVWSAYRGPVLLVAACEGARLVFDAAKFGRPASYHSYLAKAWGLVLSVAVVVTFETQQPTGWMPAALAMGLLCNVESLAMSVMLREWRRDVTTLALAWRLRRASGAGFRAVGAAGVMVLVLGVCAVSARAQSNSDVVFEGGTAGVPGGTTGRLDLSAAEGMRFVSSTAVVVIPYERTENFEARKDVKEHLGFFPAMFIGMVAAREHVYRVALHYRDASDKEQASVFQLGRNQAITLVELLRARVPACRVSEKPIEGRRVSAPCPQLFDE